MTEQHTFPRQSPRSWALCHLRIPSHQRRRMSLQTEYSLSLSFSNSACVIPCADNEDGSEALPGQSSSAFTVEGSSK
jgi:hypothetical protein